MMKTLVAILIVVFLFQCEIKKNPLSPNGPFGVFTFYYNLSNIKAWKYTDTDLVHYNLNDPILPNSPVIPSSAVLNTFTISEPLPSGLNFNSSNGIISGTPTTSLDEKEFRFTANLKPLPDRPDNTSSLKLNVDYFAMTSALNNPFSAEFPFPDDFTYSNYSIEPSLPTGFSFDSKTGIISGPVQTETKNFGTYKVRATRNDGVNVVGSASLKVTEWVLEAYLKAPNAEGVNPDGDSFGIVSINKDTIVIGAAFEDSLQTTITNGTLVQASDVGATNSGAAYVFRRTGTTWVNEAYLKAPNSEGGDQFNNVRISGDIIVVGASFEDSNQTTITNGTLTVNGTGASNSGAAYIFRRTRNTWANEAYLKAPNAGAGDEFGQSVSIDGDTIVVGARNESSNQTTITNGTTASSDNSAPQAGAAYVFRRTGNTWVNEAYLKAPNAGAGDDFGFPVAISGDTVVVGARLEDSNQTTITNGTTASPDNSAADSGAAYVFRRTGTTWANEAYLKAPNAEAGDRFGHSVSISGNTIVVGALFEDSNQTIITNGVAPIGVNGATDSGAAYVFRRTGTTWVNEAYLKAPNAEANDQFGWSVSISGNTILVGAPAEDSQQTTITNGTLVQASDTSSDLRVGAVYVFKRTGNTWVNEAYLKAPNAEGGAGGTGDNFGFQFTISISEDTIVVGARDEDSNQTTITNGSVVIDNNGAWGSGAAYVFRRK
ncbi:MAG TPA: FG-GAP repeat protein [Leptospiraceae bacterium]|nr:FG-GAP repeat protein [Leptospiraceae bacterium]HMX31340.1 FG-GAP repeat protein [Leptospiraceae bacterium]HMY31617.1 FG-GAP repeat protein [Leptospiraceae bacterium]HMZ62639.1 FG-GAP repeat protein [Leptospiraceae bacterium]HNC59846.1 FG-GAP repeat protein [Leptospiraceae bacterium]